MINEILNKIRNVFRKIEKNSDGYHTFEELYQHRNSLFLALCYSSKYSWWSNRHSDGSLCFGGKYLIVGVGFKEGKQVTYHLEKDPYEAYLIQHRVRKLEKAPTWDGHTSSDVTNKIVEWSLTEGFLK